MFCKNCGTYNDDLSAFCKNCGTALKRRSPPAPEPTPEGPDEPVPERGPAPEGPQDSEGEFEFTPEELQEIDDAAEKQPVGEGYEQPSGQKPKRTALKVFLAVAAIALLVIIIVALIPDGGRNEQMLETFQGMVFDEYSSKTIGYNVIQVFKYTPKWKCEKAGDGRWWITVTGFCDDLDMNVEATFEMEEYGEYCVAQLHHARVNGTYVDDYLDVRGVMYLLNNDTESAAGCFMLSLLGSLLF